MSSKFQSATPLTIAAPVVFSLPTTTPATDTSLILLTQLLFERINLQALHFVKVPK